MLSYDSSGSIDAPRDAAWAVLADVVAWPEWLPTVARVQPLDGDALQVGFRYFVQQPKLLPAAWVVTELEPRHRFTWQARSPGLLMVADHAIEETSPGTSRVTLRFSFSGFLGVPITWLFGSITKRYLAQEVASLKRKVEAQRTPTDPTNA
jgi:uncharacterized membrane protein